jgi:hypothetical protein
MLTIHNITVDLQSKLTEDVRPNCEKLWEQKVLWKPDWDVVWKSVGKAWTNPHEEKHWFKLLHRALFLRGGQSETTTQCRLRGCTEVEHQLHLVTCSKLRPFWDKLFAFLTNMGEPNVPVDHRFRVIIFGLKDRKNLASEGVRTTMRLAIRYIYSALTAQELDGILFGWVYVYARVLKGLRACIRRKAVKVQRMHQHRLHTGLPEVVPLKATHKYDPYMEMMPDGQYSISYGLEGEIRRAEEMCNRETQWRKQRRAPQRG